MNYNPYKINWRFLPAPLRYYKDRFVHPILRKSSRYAARSRFFGPAWRIIIGRSIRVKIDTAGLLFVHIPKTGGTSISQLLYGCNLPHYSASFYDDAFPGLLSSVPSFAVIRDPMERAISTYKFILSGGTEIVTASEYNRVLIEQAGSFDGFVDLLEAGRFGTINLNELLKPQISYVARNGEFLVDHLFALDTKHGFSEPLSDLLGSKPIPHINQSKGAMTEFSQQAEQKIRKIYRDDFKLFDRILNSPAKSIGEMRSFKGLSTDEKLEAEFEALVTH